MKIRLLFFFIFSFFQVITAQTLSPNAEVSVLTIGPGSSLNDAFGHNVFRINDPLNNIDIAYDYGRFPFNEPGFYLNFAEGKLNYSIGRSNYRDVKDFYIWQNRTIREQVLNVTTEEKQTIYNYLKNNYKPENREYQYDFFYDNCATKIKDVLQSTLNNGITFNEPGNFIPETFRTLIQQNLNYNTWGSLGIDIALGSVIDQTATAEEHMFLPEYIYTFFGLATLNKKKLIQSERILYEHKDIDSNNSFFTSPLFLFSTLAFLILLITYKDSKKNSRNKYLDFFTLVITGVVGILLLLLWFATNHTATAQNYNLLWAFPLNIILLWGIKQNKTWITKFLKFLVIMICLMAFHWIVGIQVFAYALIPLIIALLVRYVYLIIYFKRNR